MLYEVITGGIGAVGERERKAPLAAVLTEVHRAVRPSWIKVAGPRKRSIRRIAVVAGSGSEFAGAARAAGADLFLTADIKYHQALEAAAGDMVVADIGHGSGERWILPEFRRVVITSYSIHYTKLYEPCPYASLPPADTP